MEQGSAHKTRAVIVLGAMICGFGALSVRLYVLQLFPPERYARLGQGQHFTKEVVAACRGSIYDARGRLLVQSLRCRSLFADPAIVEDKARAARLIAAATGAGEAEVRQLLARDRRFVWIRRRLPDELAARLQSLTDTAGLGFKEEFRRSYPHGSLGAHVLGFTDVDDRGIEGLERVRDAQLRGVPGYRMLLREGSSQRRRIAAAELDWQRPQAGKKVVLTIDAVVQAIVEDQVQQVWEKHQPNGVVGIVLEPKTGRVLAMADRPGFDPAAVRNYSTEERQARTRNRAVADLYEPGSTFKSFVAAAVLQEGLATEQTKVNCEQGAYRIGRRTLHDAHSYGLLTLAEVIKKSSNIGIAKFGAMLGPQKLYRYCTAFGFGRKTGIELPGEPAGLLAPPQRWTSYTISSVPVGQEIACTPLQLAVAYAAIANDGVLMKPLIVRAVEDPNTGETVDYPPVPVRRVLSSQIAQRMVNILVAVTEPGGTGTRARVPGVAVAGKTGTAQKLDAEGRYSHSKHVGYFVGFAPASDPRACVLVMVDEPTRGGYYGGTVAGPAVGAILQRSLAYLQSRPRPASTVRPVAGGLP